MVQVDDEGEPEAATPCLDGRPELLELAWTQAAIGYSGAASGKSVVLETTARVGRCATTATMRGPELRLRVMTADVEEAGAVTMRCMGRAEVMRVRITSRFGGKKNESTAAGCQIGRSHGSDLQKFGPVDRRWALPKKRALHILRVLKKRWLPPLIKKERLLPTYLPPEERQPAA